MNSEQQLALIFRDPSARKHKNNPCSVDAHTRVVPTKAAAWKRIMDLIKARGEFGLTSKECAAAFGVQLNTISGRFSELRAMGWIKGNGQRRDNAAVLVVK
jgi:hypothetical protein